MDILREIFDPHFLLRNSIYVSLLVGLVCPLVGVYLVVRRLIFMGVALPQISSCGIAFAFSLQAWGIIAHVHESEHRLAFFGSTLFTIPIRSASAASMISPLRISSYARASSPTIGISKSRLPLRRKESRCRDLCATS